MQYSNFKDTLQNIASQIGNVEQEVDEHKYVILSFLTKSHFTCLDVHLSTSKPRDPSLCKRRSVTATFGTQKKVMPLSIWLDLESSPVEEASSVISNSI